MYVKLDSPIPAKPNAEKALATTDKPSGGTRFVRIEIPGDNKILTLNEVEIISGGKNIARQVRPSIQVLEQVEFLSVELTGIKNPDWGGAGQTHTDGFGTTNPWWEVDLGKEFIVDTVQVWNRKDFENASTDSPFNYWIQIENKFIKVEKPEVHSA